MPAGLFAVLQSWQTVLVTGADAKDFMQRLTTADFKRLMPGQFTPATLLAPNGKIVVYFKVLQLEARKYLLLVPPQDGAGEPAQLVFDALERMHFRESLTITPQKGEWTYLRVLGETELPTALAPNTFKENETGEIWINENRWNIVSARAIGPHDSGLRFDFGVLLSAARLSPVTDALKKNGYQKVENLEFFRVKAKDPASPQEINTAVMPLELMLDDAVHENKGCYPGQEVIERIRAIGQPPRILVGLHGQGALPQTGAKILSSDKEVGFLTSASHDLQQKDGWIGLGLIRRVSLQTDAAFTVDGQNITVETKTQTKA